MMFEQHDSRSETFVLFIPELPPSCSHCMAVLAYEIGGQRVSTTNPRVKLFSFGKLTLLVT
jgi:hypothetical protein